MGADLLVIETMPALNEAEQALLAAKSRSRPAGDRSWSRWMRKRTVWTAPRPSWLLRD